MMHRHDPNMSRPLAKLLILSLLPATGCALIGMEPDSPTATRKIVTSGKVPELESSAPIRKVLPADGNRHNPGN